MGLDLGGNLSFNRAVRRSMPVWNLRITKFGNIVTPVASFQPDCEYDLKPPEYSIQGISIAPDSIARQCIIDFTPAGVPVASGFTDQLARFRTDGSRWLCTHDTPLLVPFTAPCKIRCFIEDLYPQAYVDLAGQDQPFGDADNSFLLDPPLLSLFLWLKVPPSFQGGPRRDRVSDWRSVTPTPGTTSVVEIIPVHGRKNIRFSVDNQTSTDPVTISFTGINGRAGNDFREVLLPNLGAQAVAIGGHATWIDNLNTQFLVVKAEVAEGDAPTILYQYEVRDHAGCCDQFIKDDPTNEIIVPG